MVQIRILIYSLLSVLTFAGCSSVTLRTINDSGNKKVRITIPDGDYHQSIILVDDKNRDNIYIFSYSDSSILYVNNAKTISFPNYENIKNLDTEESILRLQHEELIIEVNKRLASENRALLPSVSYGFEISGIDDNGRYWKDVKYGEISLGYLNVPSDKQELFNEALNSIVIR